MSPMILVNPMCEAAPAAAMAAPRLPSIAGRTLALVDISKPGGDIFLDRLGALLLGREGVAVVHRFKKPTFARIAPPPVLQALLAARADAAIGARVD